jgi:AraC-like DNA-binding protein
MIGPPLSAWEAVPAGGHAQVIFGQLPACLQNPAFNASVGVYCSDMLLPVEAPLIAKFTNQFAQARLCARIVGAYGAWRYGGARATLSYLQALRIESARQTAQHVAVMRRLGLVSIAADAADRRRLWLEPTALMIATVTRPMLNLVEMGDRLAGEDLAGPMRTDPTLALAVFAKALILKETIAGLRIASFPIIEHFSRQEGGWRLLVAIIGYHLALAMRGAAPPPALSWAALPAVLHVSRSQLAKLLRMAAREGYFSLRRRRLEVISPHMVAEARCYLALRMLHFRALARAFR